MLAMPTNRVLRHISLLLVPSSWFSRTPFKSQSVCLLRIISPKGHPYHLDPVLETQSTSLSPQIKASSLLNRVMSRDPHRENRIESAWNQEGVEDGSKRLHKLSSGTKVRPPRENNVSLDEFQPPPVTFPSPSIRSAPKTGPDSDPKPAPP